MQTSLPTIGSHGWGKRGLRDERFPIGILLGDLRDNSLEAIYQRTEVKVVQKDLFHISTLHGYIKYIDLHVSIPGTACVSRPPCE